MFQPFQVTEAVRTLALYTMCFSVNQAGLPAAYHTSRLNPNFEQKQSCDLWLDMTFSANFSTYMIGDLKILCQMIWGLLRSSICWAIEPYEFSPAKFLESKRYYSKFNYFQHHFSSKFALYSAHKKLWITITEWSERISKTT